MFKAVLSATLKFLGVTSLEKENGKSKLNQEQKQKLTDKYGKVFVTNFEKDLAAYEATETPEDGSIVEALTLQMAQMDAEFGVFRQTATAQITALEVENRRLAGEPIEENPIGAVATGRGEKMPFVTDMTLRHNQVLLDFFEGRVSQYSGSDTIDTAQLTTEFGKYVTGERLNILRKLTAATDSIQYMTTIISDKTEVRAATGQINSVVQQFTAKWTPSSKSNFTPLTIKNRKHKINVPITPAEIMDRLLGYMYDENLTPSQMPIVKYIIEQYIMPKAEEDREMKMFATGKFVESTTTQDGDPAGSPEESLDGYVTILKELKVANNEAVTWLLSGVELTPENIMDEVDKAVDSVKPLYKKKTMYIHADPDLVKMYGRAYRAKYPTTKNEDGEKVKVDFSNFSFAPLAGMQGTKCFFLTPKENFIHLLSKAPDQGNLRIQEINYDVKVFGEWWEAVGFWIADAIFAYLPPLDGEGDGGNAI